MTLQGYIVGTKGNTGRGIASIVENADYTITINLTDGTSFTTAPIAGFTAVEFDENYDLVVTKTDGTTETVETDIADYNALLVGYKNETYSYMQGAINSASSASSSATSASGSATDAATYKGEAYNYMTSAQTEKTAAETAQGKAEDAQTAAETAQGKAEDAQDAAETAQTAAETAQTAAETAQASAQSSATSASSSASSASTSASTATTKASEASASATAAAGSASAAAASAEEAAESAASLTVDDELDGTSTNPVQNKVIKGVLDSKANIDGYYESLGSGTADQLASNIYEEDNTPYNFRTSGGSIDIGDRETDMVVGGTVVWNQLANELTSENNWNVNTTYGSAVYNNDASITYNITQKNSSQSMYRGNANGGLPMIKNHKYFVTVTLLATQNCASVYLNTMDTQYTPMVALSANVKTTLSVIMNSTKETGGNSYFGVFPSWGVGLDVGESITFSKLMVIDLTAMFGSTIADYIYSLEHANAGAGVAWFRKLFPNDYYEYNAGELLSVSGLTSHDMVGFNQWDEEWEMGSFNDNTGQETTASDVIRCKNYIPTLPNTTYYAQIAGKAANIYFYDANKNYISFTGRPGNGTFTTPNNCAYIRFRMVAGYGTTYNNDICINLSWDGERDGEYEEYVKHSYPLDSDLVLRGIPKLDASNNLYYDGDVYESDGTVTRKYGIVDLGTLDYTYYGNGIFYHNLTGRASGGQNMMCSKFPTSTTQSWSSIEDNAVVGNVSNGYIYIRDTAYTDAATFKSAMSGVYLVYELATPTTETADPYTNPQIVNDFGTEEYVDYPYSQGTRDVAIPVGHETQYMANLKAKLEMSPNSPEGAGDYIVRQTNGENEYVTLASNATIQDIIARLEALEGGE